MRAFVIFLFLGVFSYANAQTEMNDPVKWDFRVEKIADNEYKLIFEANIEDGWAIYSQHIEEGGPIPTEFTIEDNGGVELIGKVIEPEKVEKSYDDMFEMELIKIKGSPEFYQVVKTSTDSPIVKGFLTFMCCDDTKCLPPTDIDFEFVVE